MTGDARVQLARDALRYWDQGNWADAPADLAAPMAGHLAAAVRMLLEVVGECDNGPGAPRVGQS